MTGEQLIKAYNFLVSLMVAGRFRPSYGRRGGFLRFTRQKIAEGNEFAAWLDERGFHAPMYLAGCFGTHNWCYQPQWDRLREARYVTAYHDGTAANWWEIVDRQEQSRKPPAPVKRHEEMLKQRYRNERRVHICRFAKEDTGGFNSASEYCSTCELRGECERDG